MKNPITAIKNWIKKLPDRKHYIDFIAAFLTIPVLLTVLISNISNIQQKKNPVTAKTEKTSTPIIINSPTSQKPPNYNLSAPSEPPPPASVSGNPSPICRKGIGPIEIAYPNEGQIVSDNPLCISINYQSDTYCSVVWSYSINNGSWSNYSTTTPCLYNMPSGNITFDLRIKSLASQDQTTLQRNFIYKNTNNVPTSAPNTTTTPTPTLTQTVTPTPSTAPTQ